MPNNFEQLPNCVQIGAQKVKQRIQDFCKGEQCFLLGFITDVHTGGNNHYQHLQYFSDLQKYLCLDVMVNGGDIGLDLGEDKQTSDEIMQKTKQAMQQDVPFLFVKGNHDCGAQKIPNRQMIETFMQPAVQKFGAKVFFDGNLGGYGYYDDAKNNVRVIYLNTSECDGRSYTLTNNQLKFVIETLTNSANNQRIIMLSHYCPHVIGGWNSYPSATENETYTTLRSIYQDFVKKTKGNGTCCGEQISWDFTNTSKSAKLVCHLCGDSHFDNFICENNVNYVVRQGYGGVAKSEMPQGAMHDVFHANEHIDPPSDCCYDVLCVTKDRAKVFRIGAGDEQRDVLLNF